MKYLKSYSLFESSSFEGPEISIGELLERIGIPEERRGRVIDWWENNREGIRIHYFPFTSSHPIAGVFLGEDIICINSKSYAPPHVKLFLALHESRHCDQHREGNFMERYYDTVLQGDKEEFLRSYDDLEKDANDFAIRGMREMGFDREMDREERMLRGNEMAGGSVWSMMRSDIERLKPRDFFDLLRKQVL